jgi:hypothetical protein
VLTTKTMYGSPPTKIPDTKCPKCGHRGYADEFKFKIPGLMQAINGVEVSYLVHFPDDDEPRKFEEPPTEQQILEMLDDPSKRPPLPKKAKPAKKRSKKSEAKDE